MRYPTPSKIVNIRGGTRYTHRPANKKEPQPELGAPPCPEHLNAEAKKEWKRMSKSLADIGLLTVIDKTVFAIYCSNWAVWKDTSEKLQIMGIVVKAPSGYPIINPLLSIQRNAEAMMLKCLAEMGMSPSSRSRIKVDPPVKETDKFEMFQNRKSGGK